VIAATTYFYLEQIEGVRLKNASYCHFSMGEFILDEILEQERIPQRLRYFLVILINRVTLWRLLALFV